MPTVYRVTTPPRPHTWVHRFTVSRITPSQTLYLWTPIYNPLGVPSQTLYLGSNAHSLQVDPTLKNLYLESYDHSLQCKPISHILHLGYMSSLQGDPTVQTLYIGSHDHSLKSDTLPEFLPGVTCS